jgi:hypothetical protein
MNGRRRRRRDLERWRTRCAFEKRSAAVEYLRLFISSEVSYWRFRALLAAEELYAPCKSPVAEKKAEEEEAAASAELAQTGDEAGGEKARAETEEQANSEA